MCWKAWESHWRQSASSYLWPWCHGSDCPTAFQYHESLTAFSGRSLGGTGRAAKKNKKTVMKTATVAEFLSLHQSRTRFTIPSTAQISAAFFWLFQKIYNDKLFGLFQSWGRSFWLTPESAAKDQLALLCRISSRLHGLSQIWASFSKCSLLLGPFAIPSGNPLICNQITCCYYRN